MHMGTMTTRVVIAPKYVLEIVKALMLGSVIKSKHLFWKVLGVLFSFGWMFSGPSESGRSFVLSETSSVINLGR